MEFVNAEKNTIVLISSNENVRSTEPSFAAENNDDDDGEKNSSNLFAQTNH